MAIPATPGGVLGFQAMLDKVRKDEPGNTERNMDNRKERLNEKFEEVQRDRGERQKRRAMERFERKGKKRGKGIGTKRGGRRPIRGSGRPPENLIRFTKTKDGMKLTGQPGGAAGLVRGAVGMIKGDYARPTKENQGKDGAFIDRRLEKYPGRNREIEKEFDKRPPKKGKGRPVKGGGKKGGGFLGGKKGDIMRDKIKDKWDKTPPKKGKGGGIKRGGKRPDVGRRIKSKKWGKKTRRGKK
tara:strand:+ start:8101 stop:8823 length:723 start_codon:yes stop_codon:yes gene_type:complete